MLNLKAEQLEAMKHILEGKNVCLRFPTGFGKTNSFVVPLIIRKSIVVVILPLISLVVDMFNKLKNRVAVINLRNISVTRQLLRWTEATVVGGSSVFFLTTAEKLAGSRTFLQFLNEAHGINITYVFDEAHCIPIWGIEFRPALLQTAKYYDSVADKQVVLLSATLSQLEQRFIMSLLNVSIDVTLSVLECRKNISYQELNVKYYNQSSIRQVEKDRRLLATVLLDSFPEMEHVLVFKESRAAVKEMAELLVEQGIPASWIDSTTSDEEKERRLLEWKAGSIKVLTGTSAISLGIDNPDCSGILHIGFPPSVYNFLHGKK